MLIIYVYFCMFYADTPFYDRTIGKASSEMRLYFSSPKSDKLDITMDILDVKEAMLFDQPVNARASYISGQNVYGDVIMASIGYSWKSNDLKYEDVSLQTYYRSLLNTTCST